MLKKLFSFFFTLMIAISLSACAEKKPNPTALIETSMGSIEVELFADSTPEISKNFMELAKQGKYDSVPFHRVIKGFMIQGGDFENKNGTGGYSYKGPGTELPGEFVKGISNVRGTLSMANRGPDTNGSQFFINLVDNLYLDKEGKNDRTQHPVFAKVIKGMDVVDAIGKVETLPGDAPKEPVLMKKVTVREN